MLLFSILCFLVIPVSPVPTELLPLNEDCSQAYDYSNLTCNDGHEFFRYTQLSRDYNGASSCATCQCNGYTGTDPNSPDNPTNEFYNTGPTCCAGWNGTECDICSSVEVCPDLRLDNGTLLRASECTSNSMAPINTQEATMGKKFSCYCGGGEDVYSKTGVCDLQGQYRDVDDPSQPGQTTTRFDWVFTGYGTSDSPGRITLAMNAGIHGNTWAPADAPSQYDYFYPIVWQGSLDSCVITVGNCMDVSGTDIKNQQCYNYNCDNTDISCPPKGLAECPGGVNDCDDVPGTDEKYQMHKCNILPVNNIGFQLSCLQEGNADGTFVCYYNQPGGYSPMGMTCNVGNCLYNDTNSTSIDFGETKLDVPSGLRWQKDALYLTTGCILGVSLIVDIIRRSLESKKDAAFRKRQLRLKAERLGMTDIGAVQYSEEDEPDGSALLYDNETTTNPLQASSSLSLEPHVVEGDNLNQTRMVHSDSDVERGSKVKLAAISSCFEEEDFSGPKREGAILSWHDMKLWVPAKASDQLSAIQDEVARSMESTHGESPPEDADVEGMPHTGHENKFTLEKQILQGVNGTARKSSVTALMGPSGAGKTSLLDCLAARKPMHRIEGQVRVNGHICPPDRIRDVSGYVAQHDVLPGVLTVREHLLFHARLRCPPAMGDLQRRQRVDDVMKNLGLMKCANTMIGNEFKRGLSGGEKRRVSVAEELVVEPGILFLDEPTTGLDSTTALSICETISDIAKRGTTVLLSIHQPREDIFELFDRVLVMCEGGRVVFEGSTDMVPAYLKMTVGMGLVKDLTIRSYLRQLAAPTKTSSDLTAGAAAETSDQPQKKKPRRYNPADLILDAASCPKCQEIADAFEDGIFHELCFNTTNDGMIQTIGQSADDDQDGIVTGIVVDDEEEQTERSTALLNTQPKETTHSFMEWSIYLGLMKSPVTDNFPPRHVASPLLQFAVLSERLVLTATRHPMLVALQYCGSLFLAVCLGFIFQDLSDDLYGVQDRFGVLFFIPFCLILLGMSSLPVWRDEHILFTHEQANKRIYNFPAYFFSVLFFDLILVRTIPPIFFSLITYPMIGLNNGCNDCLIIFTFILILTNVISALIAMVVGAFRFSTSFSNLIGALLALLFALFAGFLVSRKSMKAFPIYQGDPMAYSYEALLINQFANQKKPDGNPFYYTINGSWCAKGLETVEASGNTLLSTFGFSNSQDDLNADIAALWTGALYCAALAFTVLVVSSQAPYYSAAWQRKCQINPLSILGALCAKLFNNLTSKEEDDAPRTRCNTTDSRDSSIRRRTESLIKVEEILQQSKEVLQASEEEPPVVTDSTQTVNNTNSKQNGKHLASTLLWQLSNPLGTEGDELMAGQTPPPMVLSFHNICLSVPPDRIQQAKKFLQNKENDSTSPSSPQSASSSSPTPEYVVNSFCVTLEANETLGINVEGLPGSSHAVVKQIMPKSWAHRNGVLPGDAVVRVGDKQVKSYLDLRRFLSNSPRPVLIEFLRRSPADTSSVDKLKHIGLKPILKSVSGSTLSSVDVLPALSTSNNSISEQRLPAMVCGIMGPSGAGKTSLLDCLAGRKTVGVVTGSVRINGRAMTPKQLRLLSGYVVQEDILPPMLSVRECLDFQARLRVPAEGEGPSRRVDAVLKRMKLVRNSGTLIGNEFRRGISGGEKRRVSVAIELLSEPAILFLDEPTTGQDSSTAVMLCKALKKIAQDGTTVVMSIHQPRIDIFEMMTQIVFMTREGRVAYCGPTAGLSDYITTTGFTNNQALTSSPRSSRGAASNPADSFLDIMNVVTPQMLVDKYKESQRFKNQKAVLDILSNLYDDSEKEADEALMKRLVHQRGKHQTLWIEQFKHLSSRASRNMLRNPLPFFLHGVTAVVAAITLGFVFEDIHAKDDETEGTQDRFGIMFFLVLYLSLLALTSLPLWREEQQLFIAERASGIYGTSSYVLASMIFDVVPYRLLPPIAFAFISYPIIGLNDAGGHQTFFFLAMVATNLTLSGLCMLIGVLTSSNASANAAGSLAMLTSLLFCGYLLNKDQTPDSFAWLTLWSPGNYAYEALVYNEFDGLKELYITSTIADSKMTAGPFTGRELAHCFGFKDEIYFDLVVLLLMGAVYFTAILIAMKLFIKEQR